MRFEVDAVVGVDGAAVGEHRAELTGLTGGHPGVADGLWIGGDGGGDGLPSAVEGLAEAGCSHASSGDVVGLYERQSPGHRRLERHWTGDGQRRGDPSRVELCDGRDGAGEGAELGGTERPQVAGSELGGLAVLGTDDRDGCLQPDARRSVQVFDVDEVPHCQQLGDGLSAETVLGEAMRFGKWCGSHRLHRRRGLTG